MESINKIKENPNWLHASNTLMADSEVVGSGFNQKLL